MSVESKSIYINNCTFEKNSAGEDGGAIYLELCASVFLENLTIQFNEAYLKGIIFILGKKDEANLIQDFICKNNKADYGLCIIQKEGEISLLRGNLFNNTFKGFSILDFRSYFSEIKIYMSELEGVLNINQEFIIYLSHCFFNSSKIILKNNLITQNLLRVSESTIVINESYFMESDEAHYLVDQSDYFIKMDSSKISFWFSVFEGRNKSGCISARLSSIVVSESSFHECIGIRGGALAISEGSNLIILGVEFSDNYGSELGGAIFAENSLLNISNCIFRENLAESLGSDVYASRANINKEKVVLMFTNSSFSLSGQSVLYADNINSIILNMILSNNTRKSDRQIASIILITTTDVYISNSIFNNISGVLIRFSYQNLTTVKIINSSFNNLIGVFVLSIVAANQILINQTIFNQNTATLNGGALLLDSQNNPSKIFIINSNFTNNTAKKFGGGYLLGFE